MYINIFCIRRMGIISMLVLIYIFIIYSFLSYNRVIGSLSGGCHQFSIVLFIYYILYIFYGEISNPTSSL